MDYTLGIFVADTSSLKNRGSTFAYIASPYIVTTWLGGPLAAAFLNGPGFFSMGFRYIRQFRAAYHTTALCIVHIELPQSHVMTVRSTGRTTVQSIKHYIIEFDVAGIILLSDGLALFLLPSSLYSYQSDSWQSPMIVCMIISGGLLLIAFALYEIYVTPKTFVPYQLLTDRTVLGANILAASLFIEFYLWDSYFSSFLQVVNGLTISEAS